MQQVHPLYSSPDLVAAPVESVVESGRAVLSGTRPMRQVQLTKLGNLRTVKNSLVHISTFPQRAAI